MTTPPHGQARRTTTIPTVVVSGFVGAGKTTLATHLAGTPGRHVAVADGAGAAAETVTGAGAELLVVEQHPGATPAEALSALAGSSARITQLVTVVDASTFAAHWAETEELRALHLDPGEAGTRTVAETLADQVEQATLLVLNKADRVCPRCLEHTQVLLYRLNPAARIAVTSHGRIPLPLAGGDTPVDLRRLGRAPGWAHELDGVHLPDAPAFGFSTAGFRAHRPFHPERLRQLLCGPLHELLGTTVLRSRGTVWLASRPDDLLTWSQAGMVHRLEHTGRWWATVPRSQWPEHPLDRLAVTHRWHPVHGDRRVELALLCRGADREALLAMLDSALLTPRETALGPRSWHHLADPFAS